ncbi:hypothetical protein ACVI1L_005144 [Bradyrhizobium sp. USDA 4516]
MAPERRGTGTNDIRRRRVPKHSKVDGWIATVVIVKMATTNGFTHTSCVTGVAGATEAVG